MPTSRTRPRSVSASIDARSFASSVFTAPRRESCSSRATATAVSAWSPVIMTVRMPAVCSAWIVAGTAGRIGSARPTSPYQTNPALRSASP